MKLRLSPGAYRRLALGALVALGFIVVSGGAVRLTGSGLGCPDWPTCTEDRLVAPLEYHAVVEFANRAVTGAVSLAVAAAVLGSLVRVPRRRDLTRLSLGLVAGVAANAILGGITVLTELKPQIVMGHFLLSMVLLANAAVLHHRAGQPDGPPRAAVGRAPVLLGRAVLVATAVAVFLGTVVTAAGPHGGDAEVERLDLHLPGVARLHGGSVVVLLALVVASLWALRRDGAPVEARRAGRVLLGALVAQAGVGYLQWFTGVPALLVGAHVAGAVVVWVAAWRFSLSLFVRSSRPAPAPAGADAAPVAPALARV